MIPKGNILKFKPQEGGMPVWMDEKLVEARIQRDTWVDMVCHDLPSYRLWLELERALS